MDKVEVERKGKKISIFNVIGNGSGYNKITEGICESIAYAKSLEMVLNKNIGHGFDFCEKIMEGCDK